MGNGLHIPVGMGMGPTVFPIVCFGLTFIKNLPVPSANERDGKRRERERRYLWLNSYMYIQCTLIYTLMHC